jgi:hypothetical protein
MGHWVRHRARDLADAGDYFEPLLEQLLINAVTGQMGTGTADVRLSRTSKLPSLAYTSSDDDFGIEGRSQRMTLSEAPGAVKQFRKKAWKFQQTFATPLKNLRTFVTTIVLGQEFQGGCLTVDQIVFEPKHLISLLGSHSIPPRYGRGISLTAQNQQEVAALLEAAFSDWVDFIFIPEPKPFVIFADHDEFTTFFANTRSNLNRVVTVLSAQGFKTIRDYERRL